MPHGFNTSSDGEKVTVYSEICTVCGFQRIGWQQDWHNGGNDKCPKCGLRTMKRRRTLFTAQEIIEKLNL